MFRNIFAFEDESPAWKAVLEQFPNHVPRFDTQAEAIEFTKRYAPLTGSNPDHPQLLQSVTTLIDWKQIETYLLPKIKEYDLKWPTKSSQEIDMSSNRFFSNKPSSASSLPHTNSVNDDDDNNNNDRAGKENPEYLLYDYIESRMNLQIHQELSYESRYNTLRYLFFHTKMGIYVMIRNNSVVIFAPFVNKDYENTWGASLRIGSSDGTVKTYYEEKAQRLRYKPETGILPINQWWANGNIICNKYTDGSGNETVQYWGDHFLLQLKDMFSELCRQREIPDCEFFINKRDYPQLKYNTIYQEPVEPYGFLFDRDDRNDKQDLPLPRHLYKSYLPILSFYLSERFADIPFPPSEDWEAATGKVYPASFDYKINPETNDIEVSKPRDLFTHSNLQKFYRPWSDKEPTAFFRGTATGGGVRPETNQRIHVSSISHEWSMDPTKIVFDKNHQKNVPYLDAKITGWNSRDKKIAGQPMTFIQPNEYEFSGRRADNFVEIYRQSVYKYILYVEGHCAACRYGFMMSLGSVILKVKSKCVADSMWYFPLLQPYVDHIPIEADYSNLQEVLEWCHEHDEECERIAANAKRIYDQYISLEGILDYLQCICYDIGKHWMNLPSSLHVGPATIPEMKSIPMIPRSFPPHINPHCTKDKDSIHRDPILCTYCQSLLQANKEKERLKDLAAKQEEFLALHGITPAPRKINFGANEVHPIHADKPVDREARKNELRNRMKAQQPKIENDNKRQRIDDQDTTMDS